MPILWFLFYAMAGATAVKIGMDIIDDEAVEQKRIQDEKDAENLKKMKGFAALSVIAFGLGIAAVKQGKQPPRVNA